MGIKTLEERRDVSMLEHPLFLLLVKKHGCGAEAEFAHWKTDRVFLDDGEARDYARYHRFGRENYDWRVYATPADGELRNRLM